MLSPLTVVLAGLAWAALLFGVALWGERRADRLERAWPVVYALSLAVHCTAWAFFGSVTQAAAWDAWMPPTFLGVIGLLLLGMPFLRRLARLARAHNSASLADLVASRFGKDRRLAAAITAVAMLGMVPYIALQLKAVAMGYTVLTRGAVIAQPAWQDAALWVALVMALFAMLFGTRRAAATEHNRGLVLAIGFESLFKLAAMLAIGAFAIWGTGDGLGALAERAARLAPGQRDGSYYTLIVLGALAMLILPHQFHVGTVELRDDAHLKTARWLFPLYLLLFALPMLPIAWAGRLALGDQVPSDLYVLALPLAAGEKGLALFTFLGGVSAATGMVIVSALTLSIMVAHHWIAPRFVRDAARGAGSDLRRAVLVHRRLAIVLVLALAWAYSRGMGASDVLADFGVLSFSALAQLAPAALLAIYRPRVPAGAVLAGIVAGSLAWIWLLLAPATVQAGLLPALEAPLPWHWLTPDAFLGLDDWDRLSRGVAASLAVNLAAIAWVAWRHQAAPVAGQASVTVGALAGLGARFLAAERLRELLGDEPRDVEATPALVEAIERELAAVVGAASARLLVDAARKGEGAPLDTVAQLVGEASQQLRFNQRLLEAALENMSQGISVVDRELRLVAWNARYAQMFSYPPELLRVGTPVERLVRHNAECGLLAGRDIDGIVARRLVHMRAGTPYVAERRFPGGHVVEIRGNPMPGGGFVATFTDVTAFRRAEQELKRAYLTLEQRVTERTAELAAAKGEAERANQAKSRFLAAVSHDLLQPINAAHLFTHALAQQIAHPQYGDAVSNIDGALTSTEQLLGGILDISRLDAGGMTARLEVFRIDELLLHLAAEFRVLAAERGLELRCVPSRASVRSDPQLLRRVLQNFLSNAVRYTQRGRVLIGCRRRGSAVSIEVWDTGPGIATADQSLIFEEFRRLDHGGQGLGLGLAIAERIARLLDHPLTLRSVLGRGTVFALRVPRAAAAPASDKPVAEPAPRAPRARVLLVDNDAGAVKAMTALLAGWNCEILAARTGAEAEAALRGAGAPPDLLLLDYHLDSGLTGLALRQRLAAFAADAPCVIITADHGEAVRAAAAAAGCHLLHKPLKPLALRSLMARLLAARTRAA
jgi:Na+/proline symporter/CheY-like chemotaxis protein